MHPSNDFSPPAAGEAPQAAAPFPYPLSNRLSILVIFAFSLLLYVITSGYDLVGDDEVLLRNNHYVQSYHYLPDIFTHSFWAFLGARVQSTYYRPLVMVALLFQRSIFGSSPAGFHLFNVLLNSLVAILVYRLALRLWPRGRGALWAGLLFAALPVHTEAVEPVSGISDLMCAAFFLLAVLFYTRPFAPGRRIPQLNSWLAAFAFLLAALSKEVALALPPIVILYEHFVRRDSDISKVERVSRYAPVLLVAAGYLVFRFWVIGRLAEITAARKQSWGRGAFALLSQTGNYVYKLLWPQHLTYAWDFSPPHAWWDPSVLFGALVLWLAITVVIRSRKIRPARAFAVAWFFLTLAPALNFGGAGVSAYGERYLYLPSVGFCWIVCAELNGWAGAGTSTGQRRWKLVFALLLILGALETFRTVARIPAWKNDFTLTTATLHDEPNAASHHLILGNYLRRHGQNQAARIEYVQTIALGPGIATAYINLAGILWDDGAKHAASDFLERAIEANPNLPEAYFELGRVELWQHKRDRARDLMQHAVTLNPNFFDALLTLGNLALEDGKPEDAENYLAAATRNNPSSLEARLSLGAALARQRSFPQAEAEFRRAMALAPASEAPFLSLAALFEDEGKLSEAMEIYRDILRAQPDSANACFRLGVLALKTGKVDDAMKALESATAFQPNSALAHTQLGLAYQASGRVADARRELETALRLQPGDTSAKVALQKLDK